MTDLQSIRKRILFLGGAYSQIPILLEAKERGYYIITCDYLPENPGHKLADEYYNVSTTDRFGILKLAKKIRADLVIAYASDPAAPVAAFVSEKLGLPGNPFESVRILSEKDLFRQYLQDNGFQTPTFIQIKEKDHADEKLKSMKFPLMVKPSDSSGSKGISKVSCKGEINLAIKQAFKYSQNRKIIAEEFIDNEIADIHGDGFVVNGELIFSFLGDHIYCKKPNPFNPIGTLWPSNIKKDFIHMVEKSVEEIIKGCGFNNGPINIEARINSEGNVYIMEIGPRSGGHFVPQAIQYASGFDMVKATLDVLLGNKIIVPKQPTKYSAYYAIHSEIDGELVQLNISNRLKPFIREFHQYISTGESVKSFHGANSAIGILLMTFDSYNEMENTTSKMHQYIDLKINRVYRS